MISTLVFGGFFLIFARLLDVFLFNPRRLRSKLEKQGIRGPVPSLLYGNIAEIRRINQIHKPLVHDSAAINEKFHAWPSTVFPHIEQWRNEYGSTFVYSSGTIQILCVTDPELVKEISLCTSLDLGKPTYLSTDRGPLLGRGILTSNGSYWLRQRKIIAPEFYLDRVKCMINMMVESASTMLKTWENKTENYEGKVEIMVDEDLRNWSADIISRACFGSSYAEGEKIFSKLHALQRVMSKSNVGIPADITSNKFVVDNCKNIYFAGHETTANSASWCLMTLAAYPEWQARARAEVLEICGKNIPKAEMLQNMKTLTMVIQETLRLYPPVAYVGREALQDIKFKEIYAPKGINIQIPITILHQDKQLWGSDAHHFNPDRFANGIAGACKIPLAYMPFGVGARVCAGQHFAMAELKGILSLVLSKFSFSLAPTYRHSPVFRLVIKPEHGVIIQLQKL